jgi:hypothetical protein
MIRSSILALAPFAAALSLACGHGGSDVHSGASPKHEMAPAPQPKGNTLPSEPTKEEAHRFVMLGTACWFGGLWSDAENESGDMKKAAIEGRCRDVVHRIYDADDATKIERFRALEAKEVGDFVTRVEGLAENDAVDGPRKDKLAKLAGAIADVQRELMHARRAAEKVRRDEEKHEPQKLTDDEAKASGPLRTHAALDALLALDAGDLTKEAHAIGVLAVMDRVNVGRGLPKHLKMYAWGDGLKALFGVALPDMPDDATKKLPKGLLLSYLMDVAKAAGHEVPEKVALSPDAQGKYVLAYAGMLEGIHDKLAADMDGVSEATELHKVVMAVKNRLEAEYNAERAAHATPKAPAKK